ncbi:MAG TPA: hypothetical protein VJ300_03145 [Thermoplasmata archaeon]|nr:hypothetical protein [Thermoplasmata archaeon]
MRRPWAIGSVAAGSVLVAYAVASFLLNLGGEDVAETLGGTALILGGFLLVEGALALRRSALVRQEGGRSPK